MQDDNNSISVTNSLANSVEILNGIKLAFYSRIKELYSRVKEVLKFMGNYSGTKEDLIMYESSTINRDNFILFMYAVLHYSYQVMEPFNESFHLHKKARIEENMPTVTDSKLKSSYFESSASSSSSSSSSAQIEDLNYVQTMQPLQFAEVDTLPNHHYQM